MDRHLAAALFLVLAGLSCGGHMLAAAERAGDAGWRHKLTRPCLYRAGAPGPPPHATAGNGRLPVGRPGRRET